MVKDNSKDNSAEVSHRCSLSCLGPLTFHSQAMGNKVSLSHGSRLAERKGDTFKNGLVFTSRTVKIGERIRLRVIKDLFSWHGALRVGFTTVPPSTRSLPLATMAIPDLTDRPGHWAAPVHESFCQVGSELEFWVSSGGSIYVRDNIREQKLLTGVDLSRPLWAMIDIYGQTCSIFLLGSEKKGSFLKTRRSCPAPVSLPSPHADKHYSSIPDVSSLCDDRISCLDLEVPSDDDSSMDCVVCLGEKARITLPCGHRCLCKHCSPKVLQQFGNCPLCRHEIRAPSEEERRRVVRVV